MEIFFGFVLFYPSRSVSLKPSTATVGSASVGAASATGVNGFQALDGQWKGVSGAGLTAVTSSSDDSSLAAALDGACEVGGAAEAAAVAGTSYRMFLSGDQPGGRRRVKN